MTDHSMVNVLGLVAGTLTTVSFVPQVMKTVRTRSAGDLSLGMLLLFVAGVALWEVYGLVIGAFPVVAANAVTIVLALALVVLKLRC